jgi:hypothetical protein
LDTNVESSITQKKLKRAKKEKIKTKKRKKIVDNVVTKDFDEA